MAASMRKERPGGWWSRHVAAVMAVALLTGRAWGIEHVTFRVDGQEQSQRGRVLVESQDGGVLLEGRDGRIWAVTAEQLQARTSDDTPFSYYSHAELAETLLEELPGFQIHTTANFVICFNTSRAYAQWCGALFERLRRAFLNFWGRHGLQLQDPPPLAALVFQDEQSYRQYGKSEVGEAIDSIIGYYSLHTNRIAMYDLTGAHRSSPRNQAGSATQINQLLSIPAAEHTVATIIHEATHQLAYNSGMQQRFADIPLWLNEGVAIYFETPDLSSSRGWRSIGAKNMFRYRRFQRYLADRPEDSLVTLLVDDQRFRQADTAEDAYAEAWALCYYLIRTKPDKFARYLKCQAARPPLKTLTPDERLREFRDVFGEDLAELERDFLRHMARLR